MFVMKVNKKTDGKTYYSYLVMENYRENGKVKHRTISNISKLPLHVIEDIIASLKKGVSLQEAFQISQAKSIGAIYTVNEIAKRLGIFQALGTTKQARKAMLLIAGRVIAHKSINYLANEWINNQETEKVFGISSISEDALYDNLEWLSDNQLKIEKKIFAKRNNDKPIKSIYLYDVTSTYLEGQKNELAQYGYNRDKKIGKKQIVIGLLTDEDGYPISIEVFEGNTADSSTVKNQLEKMKNNYGITEVIFVGDKGMVKSAQIEKIQSEEYKWHYLTTITKEQIRTLINNDVLQLSLFDNNLVEVYDGEVRYILRRNDDRAEDIRRTRDEKIIKLQKFVSEKNKYLAEHPKASPEIALKHTINKISSYKLAYCFDVRIDGRNIILTINESAKAEKAQLDGCYVMKTNVIDKRIKKETLHNRYKDLSRVESAFRTMKTTIEEIRPVFVRKEKTTRGHVFVVMLAYMIIKYITDELKELGYSRQYIIDSLDKIQCLEYDIKGNKVKSIPDKLLEHQQKILDKLNIKIK